MARRQRIAALDSGAVIALANNDRPAMTLLKALAQERALLIVPAPVLAEVLRGGRADAAVHRILKKYADSLVPTSAAAATKAGQILGEAKAPPTMTVDALIGATALERGATDLLTGDPDAHNKLWHGQLAVIPLQ